MKNTTVLAVKTLFFLIISIVLLFCTACKKDEVCLEEEAFCDTTNEYMPLAVGNYWIYNVTSFNILTHSGTPLPGQDTVRVVDTFISGTDGYFMIEKNYRGSLLRDTLYWRDSVGYIVNQKGNIMFSPTDFDRVLYTRTISENFGLSADYSVKDSIIHFYNHNADYFECLDFQGCFQRDGIKDGRILHNYFAKSVGIAYQNTFNFNNPTSIIDTRSELVEYHIENY